MKDYEKKIDALGEMYMVKKAPFQIPANIKEWIVKYGPYISLVLLVISIPGIIAAFGVGLALTPVAVMAGVHYGVMYFVGLAFSVVTLALTALALPGLFKRQMSGWRLAWYSSLVSAISSLIGLQLLSLIIGLVVSMYFLYQIKPLYK